MPPSPLPHSRTEYCPAAPQQVLWPWTSTISPSPLTGTKQGLVTAPMLQHSSATYTDGTEYMLRVCVPKSFGFCTRVELSHDIAYINLLK